MTTSLASRSPLIHDLQPVGRFAVSDPRSEAPAILRQRLRREGYLFVRDAVDVAALARVRRDILALCAGHGWLDSDASFDDGVYSGRAFPDHAEYMTLYRKLLALPSFNDLSRSPGLLSLFAMLLDGPAISHRRTIARISYPGNVAATTQPHQDYFYIRGSTQTYTAWIPTADCPSALGGLAVLEGSQRLGFLPHEPTVGAGGNGVRTDHLDLRWLSEDYRAGDLVLFHSHTIHAAMDNRTRDRLRISLDYRYQRADAAIDPSSLEPHGG
ncbi:MAG: phytanoyl-CoA dioxygenase family protein [Planctomycetes bacterium]|nr:phytanoyl-CoA dioxygenase family protein [Planctomycetota bacterium]